MNRIRQLRQKSGWTQKDLAKRINATYQAVGHYETGARSIDASTICLLCDIFGCTADYLLGRSKLSVSQLTDDEEALLIAWRQSDERARSVVNAALEPFRQDTQQNETAI